MYPPPREHKTEKRRKETQEICPEEYRKVSVPKAYCILHFASTGHCVLDLEQQMPQTKISHLLVIEANLSFGI
jgi:hypothetical protein